MKKLTTVLCLFVISFFGVYTASQAQSRIVVLPFQNMDGLINLNVWCYKLQDSLYKALQEIDPQGKHFTLIPSDSVENVLTQLNVDPTNPQYASDMWKAVKFLGAEKVATGNFNIQAKRFLINGYIYDSNTKLADIDHQARDIFKKEEKIYECIPIIVNTIKEALLKN